LHDQEEQASKEGTTKSAFSKQIMTKSTSVQISHVHNAEYIPLLEASKVVQEVISIAGKTLPEI